MKAKLETLLVHVSELKNACIDMETAALAAEAQRDLCTPENSLECCMLKLHEEMVDHQAALSRCVVSLCEVIHHHLAIDHGFAQGGMSTPGTGSLLKT